MLASSFAKTPVLGRELRESATANVANLPVKHSLGLATGPMT